MGVGRERGREADEGTWEPAPGEPDGDLILLGRPDCHLCDLMEATLRAVLPRHGLTLSKVDVDADPALTRKYGDVIPVLMRDGRELARIRLSRLRLERLLAG